MEQPARGNAAGVFDESHHGKLAALNGFDFEPVVVAARAIWRGDEIRMPARMALIPPLENRKLGRKIIRCESDPNIDPATNAKMQALGFSPVSICETKSWHFSRPTLERPAHTITRYLEA
jgi:hypothetical protein